MLKCEKCGTMVDDTDIYCSNCGAKIRNSITISENPNLIRTKKSNKKWILIAIGVMFLAAIYPLTSESESDNDDIVFTDNTEVITIEKLKIYEDKYFNKLVKLEDCTLEYASIAKEYELWQWPDSIRVVSNLDLYPALHSSNVEVKGRLVENTGDLKMLYKYVFQIEECTYR